MYSETFLEIGKNVTLMTCINAAVNVINKTGNERIM